MLRSVGVVCLLAGCDQVFGLAPVPDANLSHDEDGDGIDDSRDACPHLKIDGDQIDSDGDGIGDPCDLGPERDTAVFVSFAHGLDPQLIVKGIEQTESDEIVLGSETVDAPQSIYLANLSVSSARIDVGFAFVGPTAPATSYHEIAFVTANVDETVNQRGDVCFIGWDGTGPYLQANEDTGNFQEDRFAQGSLVGRELGMSMIRTPDGVTCDAMLDGHVAAEVHMASLILADGRVGLWTDRAVARIHYIWVVTPR